MFSDEMIGHIASNRSSIGYAVKIEFPDSTVRYHSGIGSLNLGGELYLGLGEFGSVGSTSTEGDDKPSSLTLTLSGLPNAESLVTALQLKARNSPVDLMVVAFDNDTSTVLLYESCFVGFVSSYTVTAGGENKVELTVSDEFETYSGSWFDYWTDNSFKTDKGGDRLCRYVAQMEDREINWGGKSDATAFTSVS